MHKLGLKLWSTNQHYFNDAIKMYEEGLYNYIELYTVPDSYNEMLKKWSALKIPYVIHAPHWKGGMNLAKKEAEKNNIILIKETQNWADALNAEYIIFHSGTDGDYKETAKQLKNSNESRALIENKPYIAIYGTMICVGTKPEEIKYIMDTASIGMCLDIGHAICASNSHGVQWQDYVKSFVDLKPTMYHLSDGDLKDTKDRHDKIGNGNYPFKEILGMIPTESIISLETNKKSEYNLDDTREDFVKIKNI